MEGALTMGKLTDKVALITGGASGIGRATAELFAAEGARVMIADWNLEGAEATAATIQAQGGEAIASKTDVSSEADIQAMIQATMAQFGRIDILFNNAGAGSPPTALHTTTTQDWDKVIAICLTGVFLGMKYALPLMLEQGGGTIINMASIAGLVGAAGLTPYAAAKAGVIELTKVVAAEYSRHNIRCNVLAPGWIETPMVDDYIGGDKGIQARMISGIPQRRFGEPSEVAHAALFLASDEARFVQGHTLVIDGGITII